MEGRCVFISGGARSGKSLFAQDLAAKLSEKVLFVATAEILDDDMRLRIDKHRRERPESWRTLECPYDISVHMEKIIGDAEVVIIDCVTLLVSNLMHGDQRDSLEDDELDIAELEPRVLQEVESLLRLMSKSGAAYIIVSNEVGLGIVPENRAGRVYRDILGRANQILAGYADEVYFMIAGIPVKVK
ncbi:MAG: bifunctional adenosylcobinamide kinase/adenosylcobinamide-phosphate guanylyltransferase [Dehalococcoidia bacterium]